MPSILLLLYISTIKKVKHGGVKQKAMGGYWGMSNTTHYYLYLGFVSTGGVRFHTILTKTMIFDLERGTKTTDIPSLKLPSYTPFKIEKKVGVNPD